MALSGVRPERGKEIGVSPRDSATDKRGFPLPVHAHAYGVVR